MAPLDLKILVVGNPGVGKTSILQRYCNDTYLVPYKATVGVDHYVKKLTIGDRECTITLWDIAGQERVGAMSRTFYKNAHGALIVYDIAMKDSYEAVADWKEDLQEKNVFFPETNDLIPIALLANKADLLQEGYIRDPSKEEVAQLALDNGFIGCYDTSAKVENHPGIPNAVNALAQAILNRLPNKDPAPEEKTTISLERKEKKESPCDACS